MKNLINAKVVYEDLDNNNQVVYHKDVSGQANQPVNLKYYRQHTPSDYQFEGYGRFDRYLRNGGVSVIYVKERAHASSKKSSDAPKGTVMIDYINADNQLVGHKTLTDKAGHPFNASQSKAALPKGFEFKRILTGSNIKAFKPTSQIMVVQVAKIQRASVTVKYVDHNDKLIGNIKTQMRVGKPFDIHRYINTVPAGYKFVKVNGQVPKKIKHDQVINVEVAVKKPKTQPQVNKKRVPQNNQGNDSDEDPEKIGAILMKLASSLHDLGLSISKSRKL